METWDLYDKNKNKLNKTAVRGTKLNDDEFHLVVNAWVKSKDGKYLISQRAETKSHPLMWEVTGGSALEKETALDAAIRELKEELNFEVTEKEATYIGSTLRYYPNCNDILEVYLFETKNDNQDIKVQQEEVNDYKWASKEECQKLYDENKFEANAFFEEILNR